MEQTINLASIYMTNLLGIVLMVTMLVANKWRWKEKDNENRYIINMMILIIISCLADPFIFTADGKPGLLNRIIVVGGNTWLFSANLLTGYTWILFLEEHLNGQIDKRHLIALKIVVGYGLCMLAINLFTPIVFEVDENNVYERQGLFIYYVVVIALFLVDSLLDYAKISSEGGHLKFFPIWAYVIPLVVGIVLQSVFYGISMVWPAAAISVAGVMNSIQNELIFRDKLTGLYNRYYLDNLKTELNRVKNTTFAVMMIDVNDFKSINDKYGHVIGDQALKETSDILVQSIGTSGTVIRYAGDEFVIILNAKDEGLISKKVENILLGFDRFNATGKREYDLSISIGYDVFDLKITSMDKILADVDKNMYKDKEQYYLAHPDKTRRVG